MPRPNTPQYWPWARRIANLVAGARKPILVGHSFGASVLLKYLSEAVRRPALAGLFLVATPFWGPDFPEFALAPDFAVRLRDVSPLYLYHSRDDPEVPFEHLERYSASCLMPLCGLWVDAGTSPISRSSRNSQPTFGV